MIKDFVVKAFSTLLDIFFAIIAGLIVIGGLTVMISGLFAGQIMLFFMGLFYMIALLVSLIIWFGLIYLLVDIRDNLKAQTDTRLQQHMD